MYSSLYLRSMLCTRMTRIVEANLVGKTKQHQMRQSVGGLTFGEACLPTTYVHGLAVGPRSPAHEQC